MRRMKYDGYLRNRSSAYVCTPYDSRVHKAAVGEPRNLPKEIMHLIYTRGIRFCPTECCSFSRRFFPSRTRRRCWIFSFTRHFCRLRLGRRVDSRRQHWPGRGWFGCLAHHASNESEHEVFAKEGVRRLHFAIGIQRMYTVRLTQR